LFIDIGGRLGQNRTEVGDDLGDDALLIIARHQKRHRCRVPVTLSARPSLLDIALLGRHVADMIGANETGAGSGVF